LPSVAVEGFEIDEDVEDKLAGHGVSVDAIFEILEGPHLIRDNKRRRRASHALAG